MGYENNAAKLEAQGRIIYLKDVSQVFKGSRKYIINTIRLMVLMEVLLYMKSELKLKLGLQGSV